MISAVKLVRKLFWIMVSTNSSDLPGNLKEVLSSYMVKKIATSGLTYNMLSRVQNELGAKGVVALLAGCGKPKVTNNPEILAKMILHLRKK